MAKIEDCPGFETFGADVKAARKAKQLSRSALADMIHCDSRYLANIENEGTLPSLPVVIQLIKICGLPVERYFNPELMREESAERQRVSHKLQLCPEEYLPIVEGAIDGALRIHEQEKEPVCVCLSCTVIERMQKRPLIIFLHFAGKTGELWCHCSGER